MTRTRRHLSIALAALLLAATASGPALAQAGCPEKPLKAVLHFPPGGPSGIVMRLAAAGP